MSQVDESPLARMARMTPTEYWADSCSVAELEYATARRAVGTTSNPTINGEILKKENDIRRAAVLGPVYRREAGRNGRRSIQTNPTLFRDADRMPEQGRHFGALGPNMHVR